MLGAVAAGFSHFGALLETTVVVKKPQGLFSRQYSVFIEPPDPQHSPPRRLKHPVDSLRCIYLCDGHCFLLCSDLFAAVRGAVNVTGRMTRLAPPGDLETSPHRKI